MSMNQWDAEEAAAAFKDHPILGAATQTLLNLISATNSKSDGWAYYQAPGRAAEKLMALIEGDRSWQARTGERPEVTMAQLKTAYVPLKSFRTRKGWDFVIVE